MVASTGMAIKDASAPMEGPNADQIQNWHVDRLSGQYLGFSRPYGNTATNSGRFLNQSELQKNCPIENNVFWPVRFISFLVLT